MNNIDIKKYMTLTAALRKERIRLQDRLAKISEVLAEEPVPSPARPTKTRAKNSLSLREAVIEAVRVKPLTKLTILSTVQQFGYRFSTSRPMDSLNVLLYGSKNPKFRNEGGKFSVEK